MILGVAAGIVAILSVVGVAVLSTGSTERSEPAPTSAPAATDAPRTTSAPRTTTATRVTTAPLVTSPPRTTTTVARTTSAGTFNAFSFWNSFSYFEQLTICDAWLVTRDSDFIYFLVDLGLSYLDASLFVDILWLEC